MTISSAASDPVTPAAPRPPRHKRGGLTDKLRPHRERRRPSELPFRNPADSRKSKTTNEPREQKLAAPRHGEAPAEMPACDDRKPRERPAPVEPGCAPQPSQDAGPAGAARFRSSTRSAAVSVGGEAGSAEEAGGIVLCGGQSRRMGRPKLALPFGNETLLQRVVGRLSEAVRHIVVVAAADQQLPPLPPHVVVVRDEQPHLGPLAGIAGGLAALQHRTDCAFVTACDTPLLRPELVRHLLRLLDEPSVGTAAAIPESPTTASAEQTQATTANQRPQTSQPKFHTRPPEQPDQSDRSHRPDQPDRPRQSDQMRSPSVADSGAGDVPPDIVVPVEDRFAHPLCAAYRIARVLPAALTLLRDRRLRPVFLFETCRTHRVPVDDLRCIDADLDSFRNANTPSDYEALLARARTLGQITDDTAN